MIMVIIGLIAIVVEILAVMWLWPLPEANPVKLIGFLGMHGIASILIGIVLAAALPPAMRERRMLAVTTLLFGFSFFIPILGLIGMVVGAFVSKFLPRLVPELPYAEIPPIEFEFPPREIRERTKYGQGGLTSRLKDAGVPKETRFKSLLALQGMPAKIANPLLQDMLGDPADEVRLIAYGILDNQEKNINQHIHDEIEKLRVADSPEMRMIALRRLAELYWELVYGGLVHGDVRDHAMAETDRYLTQAMEVAPDDAGLWFLKGRMLLFKRDPAAEAAFHRAVATGLEESRVLAYFAQIAFERRDYREVRRIFSSLSESQYAARLRPAVRYWSQGANLGRAS